MVEIRPFRAITYTTRADEIENLITQPYDKIDAKMQKEYYASSLYNYCRLILPIESNKYEIANERITEWLKEGIMTKEAEPAIFVSRQEFCLYGRCYSRIGIIAALKLYAFNENVVFPHESTYSAPKVDRLNILRILQKDLEPVFLMYQDASGETVDFLLEVTKSKPFLQLKDSLQVRHTIWKVSDPEKIHNLQKLLDPKKMVITDGHHRYESAVIYRDEMRNKGYLNPDEAFNFYMCYMVPVQEALLVLPTHRLLKNYRLSLLILETLKQYFEIQMIKPSVVEIESFLKNHVGEHAFCIYDGTKAYGLILKRDKLVHDFINANVFRETRLFDVSILRDIVFKQILKTGVLSMDESILYVRWAQEAIEKVDSGEASIAFLVNPIDAKTIAEVAVQHEVLPEKSTDFYPKLVSGLVLMDISLGEKL